MKPALLVFVMMSTVMLLGCEAKKVRRLINGPVRNNLFSVEEEIQITYVIFEYLMI